MTKTPDICIFHKGCTDGWTAAWAVWKRFGDGVEYFGGKHGDPPPDVTGKRVVFVDFSYKQDVMREMARVAASITVLDHHKTAKEDLLPLFEEGIVAGVFDMNRSGAGIAWDYYHHEELRPKLVSYVEDRDLWKWEWDDSQEISAYLGTVPFTSFEDWDELAGRMEDDWSFDEFAEYGTILLRKLKLDCENLARKARWINIGGHVAPCVNANGVFSSDLGNMLALLPEAPFGATWFEDEDGKRIFSLRSIDEKVDVGEIAFKYGGGGHRNASGFQLEPGQSL